MISSRLRHVRGAAGWLAHERRGAVGASVAGMIFNVASLFIPNPYVVAALATLLAFVAAAVWRNDRLAWIVLASTLAANPWNISTTFACNVILAIVYVLLNSRALAKVPAWLYAAWVVAMVSVIASIGFWTTGHDLENLFTQGASIANYLVAPLVLIPALYAAMKDSDDPEMLLNGMFFGLILPSAVLLTCARAIGEPVTGEMWANTGYELSSAYRLGAVEVSLLRTQVGFAVAGLAVAALAIALCSVRAGLRWIAGLTVADLVVLMVLTGSIGSTIAALSGVAVVLAWARHHVKAKTYIVTSAVGTILAIGGWAALPDTVREYANTRYAERFAAGGLGTSDRSEIWERAFGYVRENPAGVGWSLYVEPIGTHPHNEYLTYAIAFGILCGAVYLFVPVRAWLALALRKVPEDDAPRAALCLAGLGVTTVLLVNSMSDHLTANRWYFNVIWSLVWYGYFASASPKGRDAPVHASAGPRPVPLPPTGAR